MIFKSDNFHSFCNTLYSIFWKKETIAMVRHFFFITSLIDHVVLYANDWESTCLSHSWKSNQTSKTRTHMHKITSVLVVNIIENIIIKCRSQWKACRIWCKKIGRNFYLLSAYTSSFRLKFSIEFLFHLISYIGNQFEWWYSDEFSSE